LWGGNVAWMKSSNITWLAELKCVFQSLKEG